jgi:L-ascorbate metabolism protein UlaG (beta-lactamase superfamily)
MQLTYFGANGWLLELAGQRLLLDPWLVGPLRFGGAGWLF